MIETSCGLFDYYMTLLFRYILDFIRILAYVLIKTDKVEMIKKKKEDKLVGMY